MSSARSSRSSLGKSALPNLGAALFVFVLCYGAGKGVKVLVIRVTNQRRRHCNLGVVLGRLAQWGIGFVGLLVAFSILLPSFKAGDSLHLSAERTLPSPSRFDDDGRLRVVSHPVTFAGMTDAAFNQIRQYGRRSTAETIHLLEAIAGITAHVSREEDRAALLHQARMIQRGSQAAIHEEQDREDVEARYRAVEQALEQW